MITCIRLSLTTIATDVDNMISTAIHKAILNTVNTETLRCERHWSVEHWEAREGGRNKGRGGRSHRPL